MDAPRWQRVGAVFDAVVEMSATARAASLERLCGDDAGLRAEVERLLAADARATHFEHRVESARGNAATEWVEAADGSSTALVGPWRLLRELGRGGMGVVYLAERADGQFEQRAALKLIKRGMDSDAVLGRFLRERQILARLEHPHIARLLDGGLTGEGRPYFAMEYVDGEPLLQHCGRENAPLEERIRLFLQVCAAVQFAHGQLVVHRDIKPSNILVTAGGETRLLDFGIAKLLDDSSVGATATIDAAHRPLTPAYAAPEQLHGEPVTTATDIYALGAVLYELLTDKRPLAFGEAPTAQDVMRAQDTTDPAAPSKVADASTPVAARRLRGDLDTIVLKALQREPVRRYATAAALADDLQRYLHGQAIAARRDHAWYRIGKFVGRHRVAAAATVIAVIALIGALGVALWQAREKAREAKASQEVTQFLVGLFAAADPTHAKGATVSALDLLDEGTARLRSELRTEPVLRARLLHTVATTYVALGLYDRALPLEDQALTLRRAYLGERDPQIADSMDELGQIHAFKADYAKAEPLLRAALALRQAESGKDAPAVIDTLGNLATLLQQRGDFAAADGAFREALAASERHFGAEATQTARRLDDLAGNLDNLGKRTDAVVLFRRALAIREKNLGPDDADVATSLLNLGVHLDDSGDHVQAVPMLERATAIRRKIFGDAHPLVGFAELALAGVYFSQDRSADCERAAQDALAIFRKSLSEDHPKIGEALNMLGLVHELRRDFAGAIPLMRDVVQRFEKSSGANHPDTLVARNNLAFALLHARQFAEAERLYREAIQSESTDNGQESTATVRENLAAALAAQGRYAEAVSMSKQAVEIVKRGEGEVAGNVAVALRGLAATEELNGETDAAEQDFRTALAMAEQVGKTQKIGFYAYRVPLAGFLVGKRRCDEAVPLLESALAELDKLATAPDPQWQPQARLLLGYCEQSTAQRGEGKKLMSGARQMLRTLPAIEIDLSPTSRKLLVGQ